MKTYCVLINEVQKATFQDVFSCQRKYQFCKPQIVKYLQTYNPVNLPTKRITPEEFSRIT